MASASKTVTVIPLNGANYPTWKVQCQMALMKDGLWVIVNGTEIPPPFDEREKREKFMIRRDRALAIIVLSVEPSLLYLIGEPTDPIKVWKTLADQFQKKTWANKLALRRKLYSLRLKDGDSVQEHIKIMTETFNELSVIGDVVSEEDRVVHMLASLPDSYSMLVTALEANSDVPQMEVVTERLLHEERKLKDRTDVSASHSNKAMFAKRPFKKKGPICHHCGKFGHIRRDCLEEKKLREKQPDSSHKRHNKHKLNKAAVKQRNSSSSDDECIGLVVRHALSADAVVPPNKWIIDSGATSHMCNDSNMFVEFSNLEKPLDIVLGDGHVSKATGRGIVKLMMNLPNNQMKECKLHDVLYVPKLSYNLLSVARATQFKKKVKFTDSGCYILNEHNKLVARATKSGSLYYLDKQDYCVDRQHAEVGAEVVKEDIWHRRYGHLGERNLQKVAKDMLVDGFDYDYSKSINFCEPCAEGKHHRSPFPTSGARHSKEVLDLVHSDVCGKMTQSLSGAEYYVTFVDNKTRYTWVYVLKRKGEVFERFLEWKALVEKSTGRKLKVLRTDNGGEYSSTEFGNYLKREGVRHELTVPKTPEQNGVAERMNRTLVETIRCMLADANLSKRFWAEAVTTAVYLRNRSPTKVLDDMTPFEAWTGEKPKVDHFRTFGCVAYAHVPKDERQKLDSKARKCIFLGYGTETKGYRLYNLKSQKVLYSRDVIFHELSTEDEKNIEEQEIQRLVEFDSLSEDEPVADEPLRRSQRERRPPEHYGEWVASAAAESNQPMTVREALGTADKARWKLAMEKEMASLRTNDVWDLVEPPKHRTAVGSKWVFKLKMDHDGKVERHKARLVAQGFSQKHGLDYDETFCPVVRYESVRAVIALAVQKGLRLHQMDVTTAFLNGELEEEVYMRQPEGFVVKGKENLVCKLKKSIYGLKQSPRCWNSILDNKLKCMGFVQTSSDPCLYVASEGEMFIIAVYVDDMVLACKNDTRMKEVKEALANCFDVKDLGEMNHFLGMKVVQQPDTGSVWIGQPAYVSSILQKFGLENAKEMSTPADPSTKLEKASEDSEGVDKGLYQSAVGSLLYLSVGTRPDITYAVNNVARYCAEPTKEHWIAVKRIMRYLKGTKDFGLQYTKEGQKDCVGYSDADWAGNSDDRKSITGYMFQISGAAVSWKSKKQQCVALSTAEAEYMALCYAAQEAIWMRRLVGDLKNSSLGTTSTLIYEDNQAAMCMAKNQQFHGRAKHIDIKYHFVREQITNGSIKLKYCPTQDMIADFLTKALNRDKFEKLRRMAGVKDFSE